MNGIHHWVARCQYAGKREFVFSSPAFVVEHWWQLEQTAAQVVADSWAKISPHPAPDIVELIPGAMLFFPDEKRTP